MSLQEILLFIGIQIIFFIVVIIGLYRLLYAETTKEIKRLKRMNAETANEQERLRAKLSRADQDYQVRMSEASEEARRLSIDKIEEGEARAKELTIEARAESDRIIQSAINGKDKIREDIIAEFSDTISARSLELINGVMSKGVQTALNDAFITEVMEDLSTTDERDVQLEQDHGVLTSALPMSVASRDALIAALASKSGTTVSFDETVDPTLIAGVVVTVGPFVLDGSLVARLRDLSESDSA